MTHNYSTTNTRPVQDRIVAYYDQTWLDFRLLWSHAGTLALHYGYHDATTGSHAAALTRMNQVLAERAAIERGQRVLDAGCGVGGSSLWLAADRGAEVVGMTLSRRQAARAGRVAAARRLYGQVYFLHADYTASPVLDGTFDVVWALESVCYAPDKAAFYREAARLLRPGGRVILAEFMRATRPLAGGEQVLRAWLDGWAMPDLDTRAEHLRAISAAGLIAPQIDDITEAIRPSARRLYRMAR